MLKAAVVVLAAAFLATGCATVQAPEMKGSVHLVGKASEGRSIQYVLNDIQAARVSIVDASNDSVVAQATFTGASLAGKVDTGNKSFSFSIDNLKVKDGAHPAGYTYVAKVETFLDADANAVIGTSTSEAFTVSSSATTVSMPGLALDATPVGNANAAVTIVEHAAPAVVIR